MNLDISGAISKQQLADIYGFGRGKLSRLLNKRYYEELQEAGYDKAENDIILSPKVVRKFIEIYGYPLSSSDFIDELQPSKAPESPH